MTPRVVGVRAVAGRRSLSRSLPSLVLLLAITTGCAGGTPEDRGRTSALADDPILAADHPQPHWEPDGGIRKEVGGRAETDSPVNSAFRSYDLPADSDVVTELRAMVAFAEAAGWSQLVALCDGLDGGSFRSAKLTGLKDYADFQARMTINVRRIDHLDEVDGSISVRADLVAFTDPAERRNEDLACLA